MDVRKLFVQLCFFFLLLESVVSDETDEFGGDLVSTTFSGFSTEQNVNTNSEESKTTQPPRTESLSSSSTFSTWSSTSSSNLGEGAYYSSSYKPTSQSTFAPPEDEHCYTDAVLQNFCPVSNDMTDVSFWDLYSILFSDTAIDALIMGCSRGSWCLKDRFDYWDALIAERADMIMESEISNSMCQSEMTPCISKTVQNFKDCSMYPQMEFAAEALSLICKLKKNPTLTDTCYKHVITALHVSLADVMRKDDYDEQQDDVCKSPEAYMTGGLICVENSCPDEFDTFESFQPWAWFTKVVMDLIAECGMDPTKCRALLQVGDQSSFISSSTSSMTSSFTDLTSSVSQTSETVFTMTKFEHETSSYEYDGTTNNQPPGSYLYGDELSTMVGISIAITVSVVLFTITTCVCYKRYRRNAVIKDGYQKLLNDGDES